jgi:nicotinamide-nucleotide adenylyltransferase
MDKTRRGAIIGRYQIFHKGHLDTIKFIDSQDDIDEIIIGIGSSQYDRKHKNWEMPWITNPFTYEERREMIKEALGSEIEKPVHIMPIQDQHDHARWVNYVIHTMPEFHVWFTNTKREIEHFRSKGYETRSIPIGGSFHAQTIREMIALDEEWQGYVPNGVQKFISRIGGDRILRELFQEHGEEMIEAHNYFPDLEWRTFDELSAADKRKIMNMDVASKKEHIDDYLLSPDRTDINIKVRDSRLKIKKELGHVNGFEKSATYSYMFPVKAKAIDALLKETDLPLMRKSSEDVDAVEFSRYLKDDLGFIPVSVSKQREIRFCNSCALDYQKIAILGHDGKTSGNGKRIIESIGLESRSEKMMALTIDELGLGKYANRNYTEYLRDMIM